jgi:hypothetical protein
VGAFANPDAAELLRSKLSGMVSAPVFISSIVRNQQTLHRVRLGPIGTPGEIQQVQNSVRLANLVRRAWSPSNLRTDGSCGWNRAVLGEQKPQQATAQGR